MTTIKIEQEFIDIEFEPPETEHANNSDEYRFKITTPSGQECILNGEHVDSFEFIIVGPIEFNCFIHAIELIGKL